MKRTIILLVVGAVAFLLHLHPVSACTNAPSGLVSWWRAENNATDTISGNNGTLTNVTFAAGEVGSAFSLNGSNAYVRVPASASLNVGASGGLSIELWVNPSNVGGNHPFVEWNNGSAPGVHFWNFNAPGQFYANLIDTGGTNHTLSSAPGILAANSFQHVALTYDKTSGVACIYLNGVVVTNVTLGSFTPQTSYNLYLGYRASGGYPPYMGLLDEVSLYNRALSSNEVSAIYNAGSSGKCVAPTIIAPASFPETEQGLAYSQSLTASNGTSPYAFSIVSGSLPPGLSLTNNTVSGTSTNNGTYHFTVQVTDANSQSAQRAYSILVVPTLTIIAPANFPEAEQSLAYSQSLTASNGSAPYAYSVASGSLPPGLGLTNNTVSGKPTTNGTYHFTVQVTDALTQSVQQAYSIFVLSETNAVLNTNDNGPGSLRAALAVVSKGATVDATGVSGMITLTSGELVVSKSMTILGPGAGVLAVNGNAGSSVFSIQPGLTVTMAGLTITNGNAGSGSGGGIYNGHSTLTVSNCAFSGNTSSSTDYGAGGGGIANDGTYPSNATLTVIACTFSGNLGNGGGILNNASPNGAASLSVTNSTFNGNTAVDFGGGIWNEGEEGGIGTLSVAASTFSGNTAGINGGAIDNDGQDGGNATSSVVDSTFSGNTGAYGGGILDDATTDGGAALMIAGSTFSSNSATIGGGGIGQRADVTPDGSGVASAEIGDCLFNTNAGGSIFNVNAAGGGTFTVISRGYNLSSDNMAAFFTNATDQVNTDPKLGPLADNGGPTFTCALRVGSPAIDKGNRDAIANLVSNTDQRGYLRIYDNPNITNAPGGDGSDIGAYEMQSEGVASIPILLTNPDKLAGGALQFSFTNLPDVSFNVLTTTNLTLPLSNWTVLGSAPMQTAPGLYEFTPPQATNRPRGFYRVTSP